MADHRSTREKLRALAEHPRTPPHEAAAARAALQRLDAANPKAEPPKQQRYGFTSSRDFYDVYMGSWDPHKHSFGAYGYCACGERNEAAASQVYEAAQREAEARNAEFMAAWERFAQATGQSAEQARRAFETFQQWMDEENLDQQRTQPPRRKAPERPHVHAFEKHSSFHDWFERWRQGKEAE